jgi:hypothetical protein
MSNLINSIVGGAVGLVGDISSGAKSAQGKVANERERYNATGESESLDAIRESARHQDQISAQTIRAQDEANTTKKLADTAAAIEAGRGDTHNKRFSAEAANAKGLQY